MSNTSVDLGSHAVQSVGRCDQLGTRILEQLKLVMEVIDRPDSATFRKASPGTRGQYDKPQHSDEDQQDHNRTFAPSANPSEFPF